MMRCTSYADLGGRQCELLDRKPPPGQVGAEGECADLVVASVALGSEVRGEPFRLGPIRAGGVSGAALPTVAASRP
jgi:hypothetical protein